MMNPLTPEETVDQLNGLVAVARDGEHGYRTAAADVHNSELRSIFEEYAEQRRKFVLELDAEVERLGGKPAETGTVAAAVHRGWIGLKAALTGGGVHAIVAACETGEDSAKAAFERVVNLEIPGATRTLVEKQWHKIQEAHKRMLHLKDHVADS